MGLISVKQLVIIRSCVGSTFDPSESPPPTLPEKRTIVVVVKVVGQDVACKCLGMMDNKGCSIFAPRDDVGQVRPGQYRVQLHGKCCSLGQRNGATCDRLTGLGRWLCRSATYEFGAAARYSLINGRWNPLRSHCCGNRGVSLATCTLGVARRGLSCHLARLFGSIAVEIFVIIAALRRAGTITLLLLLFLLLDALKIPSI